MFTKIGPNSVKSAIGFSVSRISRNEIEYTIGKKTLLVEVEPGDGLAIYKSSIKMWSPPNDQKYLSKEEINGIIKNICDVLDFLKIQYEVY